MTESNAVSIGMIIFIALTCLVMRSFGVPFYDEDMPLSQRILFWVLWPTGIFVISRCVFYFLVGV